MSDYEGMNALQAKFLETLKQTYSDVEMTIMSTRPPRGKDNQTVQNMMFSMTDIDNILISNMKAVLSVAVYDLRINTISIATTVTSEYYYEFIPEMIPKITYGVVSMTSKYVLSQMQLYMDKSFIFAYVKERIVRPNIRAELDILLQDILKDSAIKRDIRNHRKMEEDIQNMIYDFMITFDKDKKVATVLGKYINDKDIADSVVRVLDDSKIFVPNFIYDIFNGNITVNDLNSKIDTFLREYYETNTNDGIIELFKKYAPKTVGLVDLTKKTINERLDYHGLNNMFLIDGVSVPILKVINKILSSQDLSEQEETLVKDNRIVTSIKNIVNKYKGYGVTFGINNTVVIIKDNTKEIQVPYRDGATVDNIDSPFSIFGMNANNIEKTFMNNPDKSPLTQTAISKQEEQEAFLNRKSIKSLFSDMKTRLSHRKRKISELRARFSKDSKLMSEVESLIHGNINKIKYIDINKASTYTIADDRKLLLTLAELEGLYNKIETHNIKRGGN